MTVVDRSVALVKTQAGF